MPTSTRKALILFTLFLYVLVLFPWQHVSYIMQHTLHLVYTGMFVPRVHISNLSSKLCGLLGGVFTLSSCDCSALFFPAERAQARYHCHALLSVSRYIKLQGLVCEYIIFAFLLTHLQHFYHAVCKCETIEQDFALFCCKKLSGKASFERWKSCVAQQLTCSDPSTTFEKKQATVAVAGLMRDCQDSESVLFVSLHQVLFLFLVAFIC